MNDSQLQPENTRKRGRIMTGWLLFKQSWKILRSDQTLLRYATMSLAVGLLLNIVFIFIFVLARNILLVQSTYGGTTHYSLKPGGYVAAFIYYVITYFFVNLYTAGLSANVLDLFHGNKQAYGYYMKKARSRARPLLIFSLIESTIGMILRAIVERSNLIGQIVTSIVGAAWSVARLFVVPTIVSTDEGAIAAIKDSTKLLAATWGENLTGRVSMTGVLIVSVSALLPLAVLFIILGSVLGGLIGLSVSIVLIILLFLALHVLFSAVSTVLNTALFYYAKNKQIPAAFDADLLNSVFRKKRKGLLGRITN